MEKENSNRKHSREGLKVINISVGKCKAKEICTKNYNFNTQRKDKHEGLKYDKTHKIQGVIIKSRAFRMYLNLNDYISLNQVDITISHHI